MSQEKRDISSSRSSSSDEDNCSSSSSSSSEDEELKAYQKLSRYDRNEKLDGMDRQIAILKYETKREVVT
jgi:hypothetical protein